MAWDVVVAVKADGRLPNGQLRHQTKATYQSSDLNRRCDHKINRTCVAGSAELCHANRMAAMFRSFLAFLMVVTLLGTTAFEASAGLVAEIAAAADPCCEGECPDDPACGTTCIMMMRGGVPTFALPQTPEDLFISPETIVSLLMLEQPPPSGLPPDGLKRPPRT